VKSDRDGASSLDVGLFMAAAAEPFQLGRMTNLMVKPSIGYESCSADVFIKV